MGGKLMKRFDLVIPLGLNGGKRRYIEVEAYETPVPGLFVHRDIKDRYRWALTHWSGTLIGSYEWATRDEAIAFAVELADVLEWHRPLARLQELWSKEASEALELARMRVVEQRTDEKTPPSHIGTTKHSLEASRRPHGMVSEVACG
jgi:hypothetical protein